MFLLVVLNLLFPGFLPVHAPAGVGDVAGCGPLTADQEIKSRNHVNSIECLCLLFEPDDLCNCNFVDPVASLTTAKSSQGDAHVQLAECRVSLARLPRAHQLPDRPTRLTRSQVTDLLLNLLLSNSNFRFLSPMPPTLGVTVMYVFFLLSYPVSTFLFQDRDFSDSGESDMTGLSGLESVSESSEVPIQTFTVLGVYSLFCRMSSKPLPSCWV